MFLPERNTESRGRPTDLWRNWKRRRWRRRSRRSCSVLMRACLLVPTSWGSYRHGRPCAGHPRLRRPTQSKTWMAGPSPAMTDKRAAAMTMKETSSLFLAFLTPDLLGRVAHALALVRLGRAEPADFRRNLTDQPLVDTLDL